MYINNFKLYWINCVFVFSLLECGYKSSYFDTGSDFGKASASQLSLWSSIAELKQLPMPGSAWETVFTATKIDFSDENDQLY